VGERYALNFPLVEGAHGWHARCLEYSLEYDFVTQAASLNDLYYEIERTVVGHLTISTETGGQPFAGFRRAPEEYWEQFRRSPLSVRPGEVVVPRGTRGEIPAHSLEDLRIAAVTWPRARAPILWNAHARF
jgi:hypothetical protein